jgi:hypothetical protein
MRAFAVRAGWAKKYVIALAQYASGVQTATNTAKVLHSQAVSLSRKLRVGHALDSHKQGDDLFDAV